MANEITDEERKALEAVLAYLRTREDLDFETWFALLADAMQNAGLVDHDPASPVVGRWKLLGVPK